MQTEAPMYLRTSYASYSCFDSGWCLWFQRSVANTRSKINLMSYSKLQLSIVSILVLICFTAAPSNAAAQSVEQANQSGNILVPSWVTIPAGRFMMGGQVPAQQVAKDFEAYGRTPEYFADEYPQHPVEITKPFLMSTTEVTVGQFRQFILESGYKVESEVDGTGAWGYDKSLGKCRGRDVKFSWTDAGYPQTDEFPVVNVTFEDCRAYCEWLSKKLGKLVRLPTEAEWEYSCRAGTSTYYWMGNDTSKLIEQARTLQPTENSIRHAVQDLKIAEDSSITFPVKVGSFKPNPFGLYDMHGNVWEWTSDWHDEQFYANSPIKDPTGPIQGEVRVRRGGGWNTFPLWARASFRNWNSPDSRCVNLGFRVVAELNALELAEHARTFPISILFVGDIMLDGGPGNYVANGRDPFEKVGQLLTSTDLTIGNLECVLGRGGQQMLKNYTFRAANNSEKFIKRYFHAVSLANNHSFDFGAEGLMECMKVLKDNQIGYFGAGSDAYYARRGLALECKGRRILLLGFNGFRMQDYLATDTTAGIAPLEESIVIDDIKAAKQLRQFDIVIPFVHWGEEMMSTPLDSQRQLAKKMIEAGADAVIGSHPHVVQTTDVYRGAPIVYSLGNFVFDYFPVDPPKWTGWVVRLDIDPQGKVDLQTTAVEMDDAGIPYLAPSQ